ncbi:MAG: MFS transporter [Pirellulaceae bacterium]
MSEEPFHPIRLVRRMCDYYLASFAGFRREVWILAAVTFVNRAGTMVIPFLSLYLTTDQGFNLTQVGWVMTCFGAGAVGGSWIGGQLTDRFGFYRVMVISLAASGVAFISLQWIRGFGPFCVAVFVATLVVDSFRPAIFVAIRHYASSENRTRAVTLVRLAINLGFSMGPAIGGLIIATWTYGGLFWVDGLSCLGASLLLLLTLRPISIQQERETQTTGPVRSPFSDVPFLLALAAQLLIGIAFLQYFSTMPIFYRDGHQMSELTIGLVLGLNGLLIFLFEMPLIKVCEDRKIPMFSVLRWSSLLIAASFAIVIVSDNVVTVWLGMAILTFGEMLNFPYMNRFVYDRADQGRPGTYMAAFTSTWSIAHVFGHGLGLNSIASFGFNVTWFACVCIVLAGVAALFYAERRLKVEEPGLNAESPLANAE